MSNTPQKTNHNLPIKDIRSDNLDEVKELISLRSEGNPQVEALAKREFDHLESHATMNPKLFQNVDPASVGVAIKEAISKGLTLDPGAKLVYLMRRNVFLGKDEKGKPQYKSVIETKETANGLISINRMAGRILDIMEPEVFKNGQGQVFKSRVKYLVPSYPNPRWETKEFDGSDFAKWKKASHRQNARGKDDGKDYSNPLYKSENGGPDPEFIKTKTIRHALKNLGTNLNEIKMDPGEETPKVNIDPEKEQKAVNEEEGGGYESAPVEDQGEAEEPPNV